MLGRISCLLWFLLLTSNAFGQAVSFDSTFSQNGVSRFFPFCDGIADVQVQPDGKIATSGGCDFKFDYGLARYKPNGTPDSSFGHNGKVPYDTYPTEAVTGLTVSVQSDGKLVVCGMSSNFFELARVNTDGTPDLTFGTSYGRLMYNFGAINASGRAALLQPNGKILQAGYAYLDSDWQFTLARYKTNGTPDYSFGANGMVYTGMSQENAYATCLALQPDGKIMIGGYSRNAAQTVSSYALARFNENGVLDSTFGQNGHLEPFFGDPNQTSVYVRSVAVQPDGKILMVGPSSLAGVEYDFIVCRFNNDGSWDNDFGVEGYTTIDFAPGLNCDEPFDVAVQQDGKILVAGWYSFLNMCEQPMGGLARLNTNGSIDSTFANNGLFVYEDAHEFSSIAIQSDGKILLGGSSQQGGMLLLRLQPDINLGMLDFAPSTVISSVFPNPVISTSVTTYELLRVEKITIDLVDIQGKIVQTFVTNETQAAGKHEQTLYFNAQLTPGNYILRIGNGVSHQAVNIIKL